MAYDLGLKHTVVCLLIIIIITQRFIKRQERPLEDTEALTRLAIEHVTSCLTCKYVTDWAIQPGQKYDSGGTRTHNLRITSSTN